MSTTTTPSPTPLNKQPKLNQSSQPGVRHLIATVIVLFMWMRLVFWGGWGIGLSLALIISEALMFYWHISVSDTKVLPNEDAQELSERPVSDTKDFALLTVGIILLILSFSLFENYVLRILNILMLMVLLPAQFLLMFPIRTARWHRPLFWVELVLSVFLRPLISLGDLGSLLSRVFHPKREDMAETKRPLTQRIVPQIVLGLVVAVPILFILSLILANADAVFADRLSGIHEWISRFSMGDLVGQIVLTIILLPFALSWLLSGWHGRTVLSKTQIDKDISQSEQDPAKSPTRHNGQILIITILTSINLLYLFFALIQIRYLTGAWQAQLPDDMTYAQYARSGFFELMGVSAINVLILLFVTRRYGRSGTSGVILRVMIHILLAGSLIQWASAIFRMRMYINTYALTQLRFYSTSFMVLILVWMLLLLAAEWLPRLVIGRWLITSALIAFIVLNYSCPDALIARYNVQTALKADSKTAQTLDLEYLNDLSDDAIPALVPLMQVENESIKVKIESILLDRLEGIENARSNEPWQNWTVSRSRAYHRIKNALN